MLQPKELRMELEERAKLHMEHKNHLASLIMNNAKSSLASGVAIPESMTGVLKRKTIDSSNNSDKSDELGSSSRSQKSKDDSAAKKTTESPPKKMNTGRWSADEHKRFLAGLDQFG